MTTSTATTTVPCAEQLRPAGPCWAKPCCAPPFRGRCTAGCSAKGSAPPPQRPRLTTCSTRSALRPPPGQRQDRRLAHACDRRLSPPGRQHHDRPRARPDHRTRHVLPGNRRPVPQPGTGPPRHRPDPRSSAPEVPTGHGPWLEDPAGCAKLVTSHSPRPDSRLPPRAGGLRSTPVRQVDHPDLHPGGHLARRGICNLKSQVRSRACRTGCRCSQPVSTELPAGRR